MKRLGFVLALAACGGDKDKPLGPTDQAGLKQSLDELAAFGAKIAGTPEAAAAAAYVEGRFAALGLSDIHRETFQFPKWDVTSKTMTIAIDGAPMSPSFEVFEASGGGSCKRASASQTGSNPRRSVIAAGK